MKSLKFIGVGALALALAACGGTSASNRPAGSTDPIKVGVITADTGTYAFAGTVAHHAMEIAIDRVNNNGGINGRKVELDFQDDGSQTSQSLTLLGKYATDRDVVAVIGPTATPISVAIGPVAQSRQIPLLAATVISGAALKAGDWTFKTAANPDSILRDFAKTVVKQVGIKNIAVVWGRDNDGQRDQANAFKSGLADSGGTVAAEVTPLNTDTNFAASAQKVVAASPEGVFVSLTGDAAGNFVSQLRGAGLPASVKILGTSQSVSPQYLKLGGAAVEGTIAGADYDPGLPGDENTYFTTMYKQKYNLVPDAYAALGYQAILNLVGALKSIDGEITRAKLKDALAKERTSDGVLGAGKYTVGPNRVPTYGVALLQVRNGEYVTFR